MDAKWIDWLTLAVQGATMIVLLLTGFYYIIGVGLMGLAIFFPGPGAWPRLLVPLALFGGIGYGLYALGWLSRRAHWIDLRGIPWRIWGGLAFGSMLAAWPIVSGWLEPTGTGHNYRPNIYQQVEFLALIALLACLGLLATIALRGWAANSADRSG
jgi:hypothetical protein